MPGKTHLSTVALLPPRGVWDPIQAIRRRHDRQVMRWPPHINLLYPFLPREEFDSIVYTIAAICSAIDPFSLTLTEFRFIRHRTGRCTLWLAPEPVEPLRHLQSLLQTAFPECDDLSRFPSGFTPHLSVGQFANVEDCQRRRAELQAAWQPIRFTVTELVLMAREDDTQFAIEQIVRLREAN